MAFLHLHVCGDGDDEADGDCDGEGGGNGDGFMVVEMWIREINLHLCSDARLGSLLVFLQSLIYPA